MFSFCASLALQGLTVLQFDWKSKKITLRSHTEMQLSLLEEFDHNKSI